MWDVGKEGMRWCVGCREGGFERVCGMYMYREGGRV